MKAIIILIIVLSFSACSEEKIERKALTFENFKTTIKADMSFAQIVSFFGEPSNDIGSGIHIYIYELTDSTEISIGYSDKIHYVLHVDEDGQLLHTLI